MLRRLQRWHVAHRRLWAGGGARPGRQHGACLGMQGFMRDGMRLQTAWIQEGQQGAFADSTDLLTHAPLPLWLPQDWEEGDGDYVAPELLQARGEPSERADIFSLGASLYECATGALRLSWV